MKNIDLMFCLICPFQILAFVSLNVINNDCGCLYAEQMCFCKCDCFVSRKSTGRRLFEGIDIICPFLTETCKAGQANNMRTLRSMWFYRMSLSSFIIWVIMPSLFAFVLQIFLEVQMHQQNREANCFCFHIKILSDSFRFHMQLLTNFRVLVHLNYVTNKGSFICILPSKHRVS